MSDASIVPRLDARDGLHRSLRRAFIAADGLLCRAMCEFASAGLAMRLLMEARARATSVPVFAKEKLEEFLMAHSPLAFCDHITVIFVILGIYICVEMQWGFCLYLYLMLLYFVSRGVLSVPFNLTTILRLLMP